MPLEVQVTLTSEQADYILEYIGYPIIPVTKDLEIVTGIRDQIASAVQKAIHKDSVKQKAHKKLEHIAKLIIAKYSTNRDWFHKQEMENILRRTIEAHVISQIIGDLYYKIFIVRPKIEPSLYLVKYDPIVDSWKVWGTEEGKKFPWLDCSNPEPYLEVAECSLND